MDSERRHLEELKALHTKRLQILELQAAQYGLSVSPHIPIEIEKIKCEIEHINLQLADLRASILSNDNLTDSAGMTKLPMLLQRKIVDFLISIPIVDNDDGQRALIYRVGLDFRLQQQIKFGAPPEQFVQSIICILGRYGMLEDGRDALEAILESAKSYVGKDRQLESDRLIEELRTIKDIQN